MGLAVSPTGHDAQARSANQQAQSWRYDVLTCETARTLEQEWSDLASNASEQNIFCFPSFALPSLTMLAGLNAKILAIRSKSSLIGIVTLRSDWGYAKLPVPFLRTAMHHEQYLGTPLVRDGYEREFAKGLFQWLDSRPLNCCFLNLTVVSADGKVAAALAERAAEEKRQIIAVNGYARAAIIPGNRTNTEAENLLSSNRRKSLRRARKKLTNLGDTIIERLTDEAELQSWLSEFLAMENTGWKRESGSSVLSCPKETELYQQIVRNAFIKGDLVFTRLRIDQKPIAFTLDIMAPPLGFCLKSAIDQDYRKYSPGVLLEMETLKFYQSRTDFNLIDSCTSPDNAMLNELWPDRKPICDIAIARKGLPFSAIFRAIRTIKRADALPLGGPYE